MSSACIIRCLPMPNGFSMHSLGQLGYVLLYSLPLTMHHGMFIYLFGVLHHFQHCTGHISPLNYASWYVYLFGVLHCFQHCTGYIMIGNCKGRGDQYIQLVCTVKCQPTARNYQLSHLRLGWDSNSDPGSRRQVY